MEREAFSELNTILFTRAIIYYHPYLKSHSVSPPYHLPIHSNYYENLE